MKKVVCQLSKKEVHPFDAKKGDELPDSLFNLIQKQHPDFSKEGFVSLDELNNYRKGYLSRIINQEVKELDKLEQEVVDAISNNKILSENIEEDLDEKLTFGQKVADNIAEFGGSWSFIIFFFSFIIGWMILNAWILVHHAFDQYPFMALNLILSCLAAVQAPIIMMSQNRQGEKDRLRSEHDYKINLKAELEIQMLHEKIDHLMIHQNKRLLEIQEIQADYLEDILKVVKGQTNEEKKAEEGKKTEQEKKQE